MKNISKKIFGLILAGAVLITGCTAKTEKKDKGDNTKGKLKVVTTIFPEYDITRAIAKDKVDLELMIKPGVDVHSFTPTPQDIKTVQNSNIFVYGGTEHDKWVENLTKSIDMKNKKVVKLVDGIQQLEEESVDGMKHEHHHDDEKEDEHNHAHKHEKEEKHSHDHENESDKELDPHYWTSPKNAIQMAKTVTNALVEKDPGNAEFYKENAKNYIKQLEDVDKELHDVVDKAKIKKVVIADRFPFRYLFKDLGLEYRALFSGCSVESTASAGQIKKMVDYVKENKIPVVYHIEMGKGELAETVAKNSGAKVKLLHSIHTVTKEDFDKGTTYIDLMKQNVEALKEGLN
ncbi:metal ABC transporter substrate-binding protein [Parvimonas micra]|uniref:Metal ABC transporter substrate-binding protein n=1 Tax=Parvimonas micra TaxID=33033 RepID=A0A9X3K9Y8_9FIRM|nr:metal ABC transporter substrate-binding protein [Parvimonas micra]MCZ7407252.1 metal ABC transporter substrate-binding protein [Parvimonas micra]MCZ7408971.1 metal ABC transporter substrate-binding protein [Parvimonas micra]MCZ7411005.1 metal ABC transporter substrate-binding protein [Parvimonas micra]MCZ7411386.1 metal ABC transporter substrate-binding protein [Parvimonas micra]WBB37297.1 metal ABC transporter substrate-binding protein [Parvimonas micra]